jgi:hypothetical protein
MHTDDHDPRPGLPLVHSVIRESDKEVVTGFGEERAMAWCFDCSPLFVATPKISTKRLYRHWGVEGFSAFGSAKRTSRSLPQCPRRCLAAHHKQSDVDFNVTPFAHKLTPE